MLLFMLSIQTDTSRTEKFNYNFGIMMRHADTQSEHFACCLCYFPFVGFGWWLDVTLVDNFACSMVMLVTMYRFGKRSVSYS